MALRECGIYRISAPIGTVPIGRLVYFHNHGDPGPGIYLPKSWHLNRAVFHNKGIILPNLKLADTLEPLVEEGLYSVNEEFTCCTKNCRTFQKCLLVQLGYNASADPILFEGMWTVSGLTFQDKGQRIDGQRTRLLTKLQVKHQDEHFPNEALH